MIKHGVILGFDDDTGIFLIYIVHLDFKTTTTGHHSCVCIVINTMNVETEFILALWF